MQTFLEQKHAKAMVELESDMLAELEKSKSELNQQLEQDLSQELEVERENNVYWCIEMKGYGNTVGHTWTEKKKWWNQREIKMILVLLFFFIAMVKQKSGPENPWISNLCSEKEICIVDWNFEKHDRCSRE